MTWIDSDAGHVPASMALARVSEDGGGKLAQRKGRIGKWIEHAVPRYAGRRGPRNTNWCRWYATGPQPGHGPGVLCRNDHGRKCNRFFECFPQEITK